MGYFNPSTLVIVLSVKEKNILKKEYLPQLWTTPFVHLLPPIKIEMKRNKNALCQIINFN